MADRDSYGNGGAARRRPHSPPPTPATTAAQAGALATTTTTTTGEARTTVVVQEEIGTGDLTTRTGGVTRTNDGLPLHREGATTAATMTETAIKAEQGPDPRDRRRKQEEEEEEEEEAGGGGVERAARGEGGAAVSPTRTRSSPEEGEEVGTVARGVKSSQVTPEVRRRNPSSRTLNRVERSQQRPSACLPSSLPCFRLRLGRG